MNENKWKILGWIGAFLVVLGYYLNAHKYEFSWLIWIAGNGMVGIYSVYKEAYPTAMMSFMIMLMNLYGYLVWTKILL